MRHSTSKAALITAIAAGLAACGGGSETANNVANENMAGEMTHNMAVDPSNPFGAAEMRMNERMMASVGVDAGDTWVRKMIVHHQGAIDMSRVMLEQNPKPDVARMARVSIEMQTKEVQELQKLVQQGAPDPKSAEIYRPSETQMHQAMMNAKGADLNETFLRKMLAHHQGGVVMSDVALRNGVTGALRTQIQKTRGGQEKEIEMTEAVLRGEPMPQVQASAPARNAPGAAPKPSIETPPARSAQRTTTPPPAPRTAPTSTARPPAKTTPSAPKSPCSAEHAAMGHCTQ